MKSLHPSLQARVNRILRGDVEGVAQSRVRLPSFDLIPTEPGFTPHDTVVTDRGLHGSYFWLWEHIFEDNPFHATVVEIMRDLLMGQGFAITNATPEEQVRWERWKKEARFDQAMSILLLSMFEMGNAVALMVREGNNLLDLRLQILPVRGLFVKMNPGMTDWIGFDYRLPTQDSRFDPIIGPSIFLEREDVIFLAINQPPNQVLGRAINYQAFNEYIGLKDLHRVMGVVAQRQTSRFIHWQVRTDGLSDRDELTDTDPDVRKDSPAVQYMKGVRDVVEDRVLINPETGATEVTDNIVTDERVKGNDLTGKSDLEGMSKAIETFKNAVDRKARIPPVFLGTPGGSNRATSYNEIIMLVIQLKAHMRVISEELEAKLFPELRFGEMVKLAPEEEVIQEDDAVKGEMIKALLEIFDRGAMTRSQLLEQLERLLSIGLSPIPDEGEDDQAAQEVEEDDGAGPEPVPDDEPAPA